MTRSLTTGRLAVPAMHAQAARAVHAPDLVDAFTAALPAAADIVGRRLRGALVRIGPNPQFEPRDANHHWFFGDGMVHGVALKDGRALWYRNRWIRSKAVAAKTDLPAAPGPRRAGPPAGAFKQMSLPPNHIKGIYRWGAGQ